jgi:hypothetical protein
LHLAVQQGFAVAGSGYELLDVQGVAQVAIGQGENWPIRYSTQGVSQALRRCAQAV